MIANVGEAKNAREDLRREIVAKVAVALTVSLDGYIAGPNDGKELSLGEGGEVPETSAPYTFVTEGIESAIEQAKVAADDKYLSLAGSQAARALQEGQPQMGRHGMA